MKYSYHFVEKKYDPKNIIDIDYKEATLYDQLKYNLKKIKNELKNLKK